VHKKALKVYKIIYFYPFKDHFSGIKKLQCLCKAVQRKWTDFISTEQILIYFYERTNNARETLVFGKNKS